MRAIIIKRAGYEFLVLPLSYQHKRYEFGDRFELYLKVGNNYLGTEIFSITSFGMQEKVDEIILMLKQCKEE